MAADPGVGCELGWEPVPAPPPVEGAEPGVGELLGVPCAGEVDSESVGVPVGVTVGVPVPLDDGDTLVDGVPDGVVVGELDGEQLGVVDGCGVPPGLPPAWPDGLVEPLPDVVKPGEPDPFPR